MKTVKRNTKQEGNFQIFTYYNKTEKTYVAVCLEFNIILTGNNPAALASEVMTMSLTHIESVIELDYPEDLLNRHASKKYWNLFEKIKDKENTKNNTIIKSPYQANLFEQHV